MRRLRLIWKSKSVILGGLVILFVVFSAIFAPWLTAYDPYKMQMPDRLQPPSRAHPFGTDQFGRDLLTRIIFGTRISLMVGVVSVGIASIIGVSAGLVAGYYGGWVDNAIMRVVDVFLAFPVLVLAIGLIAALGPNPVNVMIALGLVYWTRYARVVRASTLEVKENDYVQAARAAGGSDMRILTQHVLPNVLSPVIVIATLGLGLAIVAESTMSFLGLGIQPPEPSWGWTLAFGMRFLRDAPHLSLFPGLAIMITVLGFNLLGDGLRDILDPKSLTR